MTRSNMMTLYDGEDDQEYYDYEELEELEERLNLSLDLDESNGGGKGAALARLNPRLDPNQWAENAASRIRERRKAADLDFEQDCSRHYEALTNPKFMKDRNQNTDRANRAVTEQVLDPRTRIILLKLINKNVFYALNGCISTGKEANVYHAVGENALQAEGTFVKQKGDSPCLPSKCNAFMLGGQQTTRTTGFKETEAEAEAKTEAKTKTDTETETEAKTKAFNTTTSTTSNTSTTNTTIVTTANNRLNTFSSTLEAYMPSNTTSASSNGISDYHFAVKIYKTTILTFKAREKYVSGEFRFRNGYCKSNPRKMVQVWAEKELRNLKRLRIAGIPCPEPLLLKQHVLVMSFIGDLKRGIPAPRLKDAKLSQQEAYSLYHQVIRTMRVLYHECRLVHADLSEYNMLYWQGRAIIIDVSQSVEHDHPMALDFLRKDCTNVIAFFRNQYRIPTLDLRRLFDFVSDVSINSIPSDLNPTSKVSKTPCDIKNSTEIRSDTTNFNDINASSQSLSQTESLPTVQDNQAISYQKFLPLQATVDLKANDETKNFDDLLNGSSVDEALQIVLDKQCVNDCIAGRDVVVEAYLLEAHRQAALDWEAGRADLSVLHREQVAESVFSKAFIPRTLDDVIDFERDIQTISSGKDTDLLLYGKITGMEESIKAPGRDKKSPLVEESNSVKSSTSKNVYEKYDKVLVEEDHNVSTSSDGESEDAFVAQATMTPEQIKAAKKEHKAQVKADKREKRKTKMPKHIKKQKEKASSGKS